MQNPKEKKAIIYRMVMKEHICPYGLKAKDLLEREHYSVEDHWLTSREETDAFKAQYNVKTTPQTFINDERIGGYEDLLKYFARGPSDSEEISYQPIIIVFSLTALMALATSYAFNGHLMTLQTLQFFISFSMVVLALLKLQNLETFSTMFLNYDLLARRWVRYGYIYPFAEATAGILMIAGVLN